MNKENNYTDVDFADQIWSELRPFIQSKTYVFNEGYLDKKVYVYNLKPNKRKNAKAAYSSYSSVAKPLIFKSFTLIDVVAHKGAFYFGFVGAEIKEAFYIPEFLLTTAFPELAKDYNRICGCFTNLYSRFSDLRKNINKNTCSKHVYENNPLFGLLW